VKLDRVTLTNFRGVSHLELSLDNQLNVLVGDNTVGKTAVLEGIVLGLGVALGHLPKVKGRSFRPTDLRKIFRPSDGKVDQFAPYARVVMEGRANGQQITWDRTEKRDKSKKTASEIPKAVGPAALKAHLDPIIHAIETGGSASLPLFAYYATDRAVPLIPQRQRNFHDPGFRYQGLNGALDNGLSFKDVLEWVLYQEDVERRERERERDFDYRDPVLEAVRQAVATMVPGAHNPRTELQPIRFLVDIETEDGGLENLDLAQISDGYRTALGLAIDLARRMAQINPHMGNPVQETEGVVLIDEVDLHLHPRWQQHILDDLQRTFPNIQFIVTTHSPQVLTTVQPEHIIHLRRSEGEIVDEAPATSSYGAESGRLLSEIMEVDERPDNEFTKNLREYWDEIEKGEGEAPHARSLRAYLDERSPGDPSLTRADMEIRRRKALERRGMKP